MLLSSSGDLTLKRPPIIIYLRFKWFFETPHIAQNRCLYQAFDGVRAALLTLGQQGYHPKLASSVLGIGVSAHTKKWEIIRNVEEFGYDRAWIHDSRMIWPDCYATMALAAHNTKQIKSGTGVSITGTTKLARSQMSSVFSGPP